MNTVAWKAFSDEMEKIATRSAVKMLRRAFKASVGSRPNLKGLRPGAAEAIEASRPHGMTYHGVSDSRNVPKIMESGQIKPSPEYDPLLNQSGVGGVYTSMWRPRLGTYFNRGGIGVPTGSLNHKFLRQTGQVMGEAGPGQKRPPPNVGQWFSESDPVTAATRVQKGTNSPLITGDPHFIAHKPMSGSTSLERLPVDELIMNRWGAASPEYMPSVAALRNTPYYFEGPLPFGPSPVPGKRPIRAIVAEDRREMRRAAKSPESSHHEAFKAARLKARAIARQADPTKGKVYNKTYHDALKELVKGKYVEPEDYRYAGAARKTNKNKKPKNFQGRDSRGSTEFEGRPLTPDREYQAALKERRPVSMDHRVHEYGVRLADKRTGHRFRQDDVIPPRMIRGEKFLDGQSVPELSKREVVHLQNSNMKLEDYLRGIMDGSIRRRPDPGGGSVLGSSLEGLFRG